MRFETRLPQRLLGSHQRLREHLLRKHWPSPLPRRPLQGQTFLPLSKLATREACRGLGSLSPHGQASSRVAGSRVTSGVLTRSQLCVGDSPSPFLPPHTRTADLGEEPGTSHAPLPTVDAGRERSATVRSVWPEQGPVRRKGTPDTGWVQAPSTQASTVLWGRANPRRPPPPRSTLSRSRAVSQRQGGLAPGPVSLSHNSQACSSPGGQPPLPQGRDPAPSQGNGPRL